MNWFGRRSNSKPAKGENVITSTSSPMASSTSPTSVGTKIKEKVAAVPFVGKPSTMTPSVSDENKRATLPSQSNQRQRNANATLRSRSRSQSAGIGEKDRSNPSLATAAAPPAPASIAAKAENQRKSTESSLATKKSSAPTPIPNKNNAGFSSILSRSTSKSPSRRKFIFYNRMSLGFIKNCRFRDGENVYSSRNSISNV